MWDSPKQQMVACASFPGSMMKKPVFRYMFYCLGYE
jgi:hypothetical protein